jgi:hypothetical protein
MIFYALDTTPSEIDLSFRRNTSFAAARRDHRA